MAELSGHLWLRARRRGDGQTVLAEKSFRTPYHLGKAYWDSDAASLWVQVVNPTAGLLAGDRLESEISVEEGAALTVTTPSATRVFTMTAGHGECRQSFRVASGAWLEFLPEPLLPHRNSHYRQATEIEVAGGGELVFADFLLPGRLARGEAWSWSRLCLDLSVRVAGEPVLRERFDQSGAELRALAELADAGAGAQFGNLVLISPRLAEESGWRAELAALHADGTWVGVSPLRGPPGGWSVKIVAREGIALRETFAAVRRILASRLPRLRLALRKL